MMAPAPRPGTRLLMYGLVGAQLAILGWVVAFQETNRALDRSVPVDLEIPHAYAQKDPFRGAYLRGEPIVALRAPEARLPPGPLAPGDRVLVVFASNPGKRPRIDRVERRHWWSDPGFTPSGFSVPGRVIRLEDAGSFTEQRRGLVATVGPQSVRVALEFPTSIAIEDRALGQLTSPSFVRVGLRQGFLGHRYLSNIRLAGVSFGYEMSFAYDEARDRLVAVAPRGPEYERSIAPAEREPRTDLFAFDGSGKEIGSTEVTARLLGAATRSADGTLWTLLSTEHYGTSTQLAQIREDGTVARRGPAILSERLLGFDAEKEGIWVLAGPPLASPHAPFAVELLTLDGARDPQVGPFPSRPHGVVSRGAQVWVLETDQHRVTRLNRSGQVEREYRDLNNPLAVDPGPGSLFIIEASRTQLSKFSSDGTALWRVPRFKGLAWVLPDADSGGGWTAAQGFEGLESGVFRFDAEGRVSRLPVPFVPRTPDEYGYHRLGQDAARSSLTGRIYLRDVSGIVILEADGSPVRRAEGFRFAMEKPLQD